MKTILVTGFDGYIGYPLSLRLLRAGHKVIGVDNGFRRYWVESVGSKSVIPIDSKMDRIKYLKKVGNFRANHNDISLGYHVPIEHLFKTHNFDAVFHLAAQPSAPYSFKDNMFTIRNNLDSTMNIVKAITNLQPECRLFFTSTMGEYGTPNIEITPGFIEIPDNIDYLKNHGMSSCPPYDKMLRLPFPRDPSSWYHLSKVFCTQAIYLAHKLSNIKSTVFMQGVVYGTRTNDMLPDEKTRFDSDFYYGTVLNRFICQALTNQPLTIYGKGGQTRGLLSLEDAVEGFAATLDIEDDIGFRVVNQLSTIISITSLAETVVNAAEQLGIDAKIKHIPNPRKEAEYHQYDVDYSDIRDVGYSRQVDFETEILEMLKELEPLKDIPTDGLKQDTQSLDFTTMKNF